MIPRKGTGHASRACPSGCCPRCCWDARLSCTHFLAYNPYSRPCCSQSVAGLCAPHQPVAVATRHRQKCCGRVLCRTGPLRRERSVRPLLVKFSSTADVGPGTIRSSLPMCSVLGTAWSLQLMHSGRRTAVATSKTTRRGLVKLGPMRLGPGHLGFLSVVCLESEELQQPGPTDRRTDGPTDRRGRTLLLSARSLCPGPRPLRLRPRHE